MTELPGLALTLCDGEGRRFGTLRLARRPGDVIKGECIFDVAEPGDTARPEVRWLHKRRYQRMSEHKFTYDEQGVLTVSGPDFRVHFEPLEDGALATKPPAPRVLAQWVAAS